MRKEGLKHCNSLEEENAMLKKELDAARKCNTYLKHEISVVKEVNESYRNLFDICYRQETALPSETQEEKEKILAKLQDQHQQDCIRINDLTTTIHVLSGLYSNLRKTVGMD